MSSEIRIWAIETLKWNPTCPITCRDVIVAARCSRGSRSFGRTTGYGVPRITTAVIPGDGRPYHRPMELARARAIVDFVVSEAPRPVSVFVADAHGELVAAATMDGAAPDTRLNAQRKAYTAARSDARTTRELAGKARENPVERASFDPFFTFFLGGVAVFDGDRRIGAVGVSGLPGDVDEQLVLRAIAASE